MSNREVGRSLDIAIMESITFLKRLNSWDLKKVIIPERLETLSLLLKENRQEGISGTGKMQAYFKEEHQQIGQWKVLPHMTTK
jgi:hypothetical protein